MNADAKHWNNLSRALSQDPDMLRRQFNEQMTATLANFTAALGPPADPLPWLDDDENVAAEDRPMQLECSPFDDIPEPIDPYRQLSGDEE